MSEKGDSYDKWLERGERLGLSGTKLQEFVSRQQNEFHEREERALRRAQEREDKLKIQDDAHQKAMAELREKELIAILCNHFTFYIGGSARIVSDFSQTFSVCMLSHKNI